MPIARRHQDLVVHQTGFRLAMEIFQHSKRFPIEEKYSLTDQIRRSSRSVTANIAEGWAQRRYESAFILKLTLAAGEAAETVDWLNYARACGYLPADTVTELAEAYDEVTRTLNAMVLHSASWCSSQTGFKAAKGRRNQ